MESSPRWLAMGYSVPPNPTRLRVYVWRKLKDLGVQYFKPTVAVLPNNFNNLQNFIEVSNKIKQLGGEAWVLELNFISNEDNQTMVDRFKEAISKEKENFLAQCTKVLNKLDNCDSEQQRNELTADLKKIAKNYQKNVTTHNNETILTEMDEAMEQVKGVISGMKEELSSVLKLWNKVTSSYKNRN